MPRAENYFWKVDRWNGGYTKDSRIGLPGAFRYGVGLDYRSDSGLLQLANRPVKDSDSDVDVLTHWIDINPANNDVYSYGSNGDIVKESGGTYTLARAVTADNAAGQGMADFDEYLYYAQDTQLGRFDYSSTWTDNWQTGLTSATWHPMARFKNLLLVGHGRYIGTVDDVGTWTAQALTLPPGYYARSIFKVGNFACILATRGQNISDSDEGFMFLWNGTSETYNQATPLDGNPHAGIAINNRIIIIAGVQPVILESLGGVAEIKKTIPKVGIGKTAEVFPGAIDQWRNMAFFGISDGTDTNVLRAVYSYGARDKENEITDTLNVPYPTSEYDSQSGNITGTGVQIGAVRKVGTTLRFGWKDGSNYGIDEVDTTQYLTEGVWRSLAFDNTSPYEKLPQKVKAEFAGGLAANETITIKISDDPYGDDDFSETTGLESAVANTTGDKKLELPLVVVDDQIRSADLHLELTLTGNGSSTPKMKRIWVEVDEDTDTI